MYSLCKLSVRSSDKLSIFHTLFRPFSLYLFLNFCCVVLERAVPMYYFVSEYKPRQVGKRDIISHGSLVISDPIWLVVFSSGFAGLKSGFYESVG